jgi:hypothetical protein
MNNIFITATKLSRIMNLHHDTTKKHLKALRVPTYKVGKRTYYRTAEVLPLLQQNGVTV